MTFFCPTRILRVNGRQSIRQLTDFFTDFLAYLIKITSKIKFIKLNKHKINKPNLTKFNNSW